MKKMIKNLIAQCRHDKDYFIKHCLTISDIKNMMEKLANGQKIVIRTPDNITITITSDDSHKAFTKVDWNGGSN